MATTTTTPSIDVDRFWEYGYAILPQVYSADEIAELRRAAAASQGKPNGDLLSNPQLSSVITDGRMAAVARQLLGEDEIVYAGDSSFTINSSQHGYHKDNADRNDPKAPDWQSRYTLLRFGIYLQDHVKHTGGLNLREKSHDTVSLTEGKNIYVQTRPGDLAVWSMRTSHSGNGTLLSFPRWVHPEPAQKQEDYPWYWRVAKHDGDRMAVFVALGLDDAHHHRYVDYLKTRTYICDMWRRSSYDEATLARAAANGVTVRNMPEEIAGDDTVGANELWKPIPY